jgi:hypothetical protein
LLMCIPPLISTWNFIFYNMHNILGKITQPE